MASPLIPSRRDHSVTSQAWRRNALLLDYAMLDPAYQQGDEYALWVERRFNWTCNIPVAEDPLTGLLLPPWAFAAGDQAVFAATFVGYVDSRFVGTQKRVPVMTFGGSIEGYLVIPEAYRIHTWFTLEDNPITTKLHAFYYKPTLTVGERIAWNKSSRTRKRETVELNYMATTLFSATLAGGPMPPPEPPGP